jgi:hypothetical protein
MRGKEPKPRIIRLKKHPRQRGHDGKARAKHVDGPKAP